MKLAAALSDRLNPIVVKELRQAVQGRFTSGVLLFLLALEIFALGMQFLTQRSPTSVDFYAGQTAFVVLHSVLLAVCLLFLPGYAFIRLAKERADAAADLLFITTLRPRSVIAGKLLAALTLCLLLYAASMPFLTLTYFLRGIDLPTIFGVSLVGFLFVAAGVQLAILFAALPASRPAQLLLGIGLLWFLLMFFAGIVGSSTALFVSGFGSRMRAWSSILTVLVPFLVTGAILFSLSTALVTPPAANRALPVRVLITILWLVAGAAAVALELRAGGSAAGSWVVPFWRTVSWLRVWAVSSIFLSSAALIGAVGEREQWGPRVARTIPRRLPLRVPSFLFYSGAAGGVLWAGLLAALTLATVWLYRISTSASHSWEIVPLAGIVLYSFAYAMTAVAVRRYLLASRVPPSKTALIALLLLAAASTMPTILGGVFFYDTWKPDEQWIWSAGNPFALGRESIRGGLFRFAALWAAVIGLLALPWFLEQFRRFRRYEPRSEAAQWSPDYS